jgi:hypothetical protein
MVLGILAVVPAHGMMLSLILGPIAWILGNNDLKEIRAGRMDPEGEGMTQAGRVCGIIGTFLGLLALMAAAFFLCIWLGLVAALFGAAASQPSRPAPPRVPPPRRGMDAPQHPVITLPRLLGGGFQGGTLGSPHARITIGRY